MSILKKDEKFIKKFEEKIKYLINDFFDNNLDVKPYKGKKNTYRLRIGKYRFLFEVIEEQKILYIFSADSRGDIYK